MVRWVGLFGLVAAVACSTDTSGPAEESLVPGADLVPVTDNGAQYWPGSTWRAARASDAGLNEPRLYSALASFHTTNPLVHGVVVVKNGYRVIDRYFSGSSATDLHTLQSVSKSVTSLLVGIAVDRNLVSSIDQPVMPFFPEYTDLQNVDDNKRALTIRNLLAMRTGMSFYEQPYPGSPLQQLNDCACDWLHFILDRPMSGVPGQQWAYNSGGVILLGGVIRSVAGVAADEFARQNLFAPLGIERFNWIKGNPNGLPHMGGGLFLTSDDLARIGYLVLRHGNWNGDQIVSSQWLDQSTARVSAGIPNYFPRTPDYGLLWWLFPRNGSNGPASNDDYIIAAVGTGGQWMFIDRTNDLVAVFTSELSGGTWPALSFFFNEILPSVVP